MWKEINGWRVLFQERSILHTRRLYESHCFTYFVTTADGVYRLYEAQQIDSAISEYHTQAGRIHLGDSKENVLGVLALTQQQVPPESRRSSEAFTAENGVGGKSVVEICYFRSARVPDGLNTDDEFTPYIFRDGVLTAIGWTALGGPKTFGKFPTAPSNIIVESSSHPPKSNFTCMRTGPFLNCQ